VTEIEDYPIIIVTNEFFKENIFAELQSARQVETSLFAFAAHDLQGIGLRIDRGHTRGNTGGLALHDKILFLIEQGQHFAILLELFA
jgi:hypothetical protein